MQNLSCKTHLQLFQYKYFQLNGFVARITKGISNFGTDRLHFNMKAASLSDIKKELLHLDPDKVRELCMRLAKYKVENKELLTYQLFEAHDETAFVANVNDEMDHFFGELNKSNLYLVKKGLRKILRLANKQIRYSGIVTTEIEVRIHFCQRFKKLGIRLEQNTVLFNMYHQQLKKIDTALAKMPEDLQYDYEGAIKQLQ
jgi:hypothetical protein